jgi:hypothetical protein
MGKGNSVPKRKKDSIIAFDFLIKKTKATNSPIEKTQKMRYSVNTN